MENNRYIKIILTIIASGIWVIVLQNFNKSQQLQDVYVRGGSINVDNTIDVQGSVDVDNTVDVNLDEVLGYPVGCRTSYSIDGVQYNSIDVSIR